MAKELKVPEMGESITEGTITEWRVSRGDSFSEGDPLVEIETDKITMDVPAPADGTLEKIHKGNGENVEIGEVIASYNEGKVGSNQKKETGSEEQKAGEAKSSTDTQQSKAGATSTAGEEQNIDMDELPPSVRHLIEEHDLNPANIKGTGKHGMILKEDVLAYLEQKDQQPDSKSSPAKTDKDSESTGKDRDSGAGEKSARDEGKQKKAHAPERTEQAKPMSRLRKRIAERLVQAQHEAAILTTFNEVDMSAVMDLRSRYRDAYKERHGVSLGFMSFFTKAVIEALKEFPAINAEIRGDDIIYKYFYNIGIAVGGPRGLVVPVVKDADLLSFAEVEKEIGRLAQKVQDSTITIDDLEGGTFSISNGGIYGSMLSTPILNPPQSGILGMHKIEKKPVVINEEIVIRPMMYLALSYDHRIVDGKEAVQFLVRLKECIEDPQRILLDI